jgi:tetratricopeptide (TPR) repeat protein
MMATTNSAGTGRWTKLAARGAVALGATARRGGLCLGAIGLFLCGGPGFCEDNSNLVQRAEQKYQEARKRFQDNTNDVEAAWQFGRACFDRAEFSKNDDQREMIANQGIAACRPVIERDPKSAPGHYYLAMNLGQLARTKTLGALKLVDEMEREFKLARNLDPKFDYAGPDRNLGLLYFEAPGWPASIGNKSKARKHLEQTAELVPTYPENHLCLLEAYLKWGDQKNAQRELKATEELLSKARKEFSGDDWTQSWADWDKRWKKIRDQARKK